MQRACAAAIRLLSGMAAIVTDSFRDAYVATGMNLVQSILLCTVGILLRVQGSGLRVQGSGSNPNENPEP